MLNFEICILDSAFEENIFHLVSLPLSIKCEPSTKYYVASTACVRIDNEIILLQISDESEMSHKELLLKLIDKYGDR